MDGDTGIRKPAASAFMSPGSFPRSRRPADFILSGHYIRAAVRQNRGRWIKTVAKSYVPFNQFESMKSQTRT